MIKVINNRILQTVLFLLFIALAAHLLSPRGKDIQAAINKLQADPALNHATISFLATDSDSGKRIAALNPETATVRASAQKLFATSMAIEILGQGYRPVTRLYIDGTIENGVLRGNLIIEGRGDVTLGSRYFADADKPDQFLYDWADRVVEAGITSITGRVITDGSAFSYRGTPDGWSWFDLGNYYGAGPSGISLYDNSVEFVFKAGDAPGHPAELLYTTPDIAELSFRNFLSSEDVKTVNVAFYGAPFSYDRMAVGSLPLGHTNAVARASMPDPEWQMAVEFASALKEKGVGGTPKPAAVRRDRLNIATPFGMELIYEHQGPTIAEIVKVTNQQSVNLFAEQLVQLIGLERAGEGSTEAGLAVITEFLGLHIDTGGLHLADGCGMSRLNAISAQHICALLNHMFKSDNHETFHNSLAIAGQSGTLSRVCKGEAGEGRVFAKTGTMTRTKSFIGYVHSKSGKRLTFAFTIVNFDCSTWEITEKMEQVLNTMAEY